MSNDGLIFTALEVEQFRRFSGICRLDGLGPGLNLLAAPNESGKSTMLAALRALFFCKTGKSGSSTKLTRSFEPYSGGVPRIRAEFLVNGTFYCYEKQFLKRQFTCLTGPNKQFDGDDAEHEVQHLLGLDNSKNSDTTSLLSTLWIEQGQSFSQPNLTEPTKQTIQSCLTSDFDEITGGADAGRILKRVQDDLGELLNGHGKPKGNYALALEGEQEATRKLDSLETRRRTLEQDLADLAQSRRLLDRENDPERQKADQEELEQAKTKKERLLRFATQEAQAQAAVHEADRELHRYRGEQTRRTERRARLAIVRKECLAAEEECRQAEVRLREADDVLALHHAHLGKS